MFNAGQDERDTKDRSMGEGRSSGSQGGNQGQGGGSNDGRANNGRNLSTEDRSRGGQAAAAQNKRDDEGRFVSENR